MNKFAIPLGFPGWKIWAVLGLPVAILIDVMHDDETGVYIATSKNVRGLVVEAETLDQIKVEVEGVLMDMLRINYPISGPVKSKTSLCFSSPLALA